MEDLKSIHNGIQIYDKLRVFSGDGPARQFEVGHQRGGNFSSSISPPFQEESRFFSREFSGKVSLRKTYNLLQT